MWNRIVHVQEVELVEFSHFSHTRSQRKIVRWELKKWIVRNRNLVIEDALFAADQPEWLRIGNEMHLVSKCSKLNAQFGCHDARSAISGVTRDSNPHSFCP